MSRITNIYNQVDIYIQRHLEQLLLNLVKNNDTGFTNLSITQIIFKLFKDILSILATVYELVRYFTVYQFKEIITIPS